jgi:leucine-rich repeat protein SHOC2
MFFSKSPEQNQKRIIAWLRGLKINVPMDTTGISNINRLDLSFRGIIKIPGEIGCLKNLTELNLSNNRLADLPKDLSKIGSLKSLNLGYNLFRT